MIAILNASVIEDWSGAFLAPVNLHNQKTPKLADRGDELW